MPHLVAVSVAENHDPEPVLDNAERALRQAGGGSSVWRVDLGRGAFVLGCGADSDGGRNPRGEAPPGDLAWWIGSPPVDLAGGRLARSAWRSTGADARGDLAPPYGACRWRSAVGALEALTDPAGLQHVYWSQGRGMALAASSARTARALIGSEADLAALGTAAWLGHFFGDETAFVGVRKLPAGGTVSLLQGVAQVVVPPVANAGPDPTLGFEQAVEEGAAVLRASVGAYLASYPDLGFELSGGLDSRLLLAAVPAGEREGRSALTLTGGDVRDAEIAAGIAAREQLTSETVDLRNLRNLRPDEALERIRGAARTTDYGFHPASRAVLEWAGEAASRTPRLSGQNGEFVRGFYYAGQQQHGAHTPELVDRLYRWRLKAHERPDPSILAAEYVEEIEQRSQRLVRGWFEGRDLDWLSATDEYYLAQRMQRWVGATFTVENLGRPVLAPFFTPGFIAWSRGVRPEWRRGSRIAARVLCRLDPGLGGLSLASGSTPRYLAGEGTVAAIRSAAFRVLKTGQKVFARIRGTRRAPSGAAALFTRAVLAADPLEAVFPRLAARGLVRPEAISAPIAAGRIGWRDFGFLLTLELAEAEGAE